MAALRPVDFPQPLPRCSAQGALRGEAAVLLPGRRELEKTTVVYQNGTVRIAGDPLAGQVNWRVTCVPGGACQAGSA